MEAVYPKVGGPNRNSRTIREETHPVISGVIAREPKMKYMRYILV